MRPAIPRRSPAHWYVPGTPRDRRRAAEDDPTISAAFRRRSTTSSIPPGDPQLARRVALAVAPTPVALDEAGPRPRHVVDPVASLPGCRRSGRAAQHRRAPVGATSSSTLGTAGRAGSATKALIMASRERRAQSGLDVGSLRGRPVGPRAGPRNASSVPLRDNVATRNYDALVDSSAKPRCRDRGARHRHHDLPFSGARDEIAAATSRDCLPDEAELPSPGSRC